MRGLLISALFIFVAAGCATSISTQAKRNREPVQNQQVESAQVERDQQRAEIERLKKLDDFTPDW